MILPYLKNTTNALEIGCGHGRWSKILSENVTSLILIDVSPSCIDFCKNILKGESNLTYIVNSGKSLEGVDSDSVDFIWSYDSFVHMDKKVINAYIIEIARVLKSNGIAIIHHAGRNNNFLWLGFTRHWGNWGRNFYKIISMRRLKDHDGWRSNISRANIRNFAFVNHLQVVDQIQFWDVRKLYGVPRFNDCITILRAN